jgi:hypothetical protein
MTQLSEEGSGFYIPTHISFKDYVKTFDKLKRTEVRHILGFKDFRQKLSPKTENPKYEYRNK